MAEGERKFEVSDFTLTHTRQLSAAVSFYVDVWGHGFTKVHEARVSSVFSPLREIEFWFPAAVAEAEFPEALREEALGAVDEAWRKATGRAPRGKGAAPYRLENHGTIALVRPLTPECRQWLDENTDGTWFGGALAVEPRYVDDLLLGLEEAAI